MASRRGRKRKKGKENRSLSTFSLPAWPALLIVQMGIREHAAPGGPPAPTNCNYRRRNGSQMVQEGMRCDFHSHREEVTKTP